MIIKTIEALLGYVIPKDPKGFYWVYYLKRRFKEDCYLCKICIITFKKNKKNSLCVG